MALAGGPSASQRLFHSPTSFPPAPTPSSSSSSSNASSSKIPKAKVARGKVPPTTIKREQGTKFRTEMDSEGRSTSVTSDGGSGDDNGRVGKKKKANRACAACQKAHLTCDDERPCTRCVKKGMGAQCTDGKRKRAKYLLDEDELEAVKARERAEKEQKDLAASSLSATSRPRQQADAQTSPTSSTAAAIAGPPPFVDTIGLSSPNQVASTSAPQLFGTTTLFANEGVGTSHNTPPHAFESEATSLEYSILSAMLNGIDPSLLSGSPDQDGTSFGASFSDTQVSAITPGVTSGIDFKEFFDGGNGGTNLPSVGMATDQSSHWLLDSSQFLGQQQNGGMWGSSSSGANPFIGASSSGANPPNGQQTQPAQPLGQLHAIGGNDTGASAGEFGGGGFKALEVPSPSPSLTSTHRLGMEERYASGTPPEVAGKAGGLSTQQGMSSSDHGANTVATRGGAGYNGPGVQVLEAQWRDRVNQIYASLAKPFPYTEGYHFLLKFVTEKFEKAEVLRIVRALGLFRPSLIALQMPLTEEDEIFVERSIQRTILEFEKLISFSGTPTVVWRRTCEICVVGSEFSMLTGWSRDTLLGRRVYEFWDKNSTLEYWEKFALHAFENTSQSIVANVVLKRPDGSSVPCAACFSIKRNVFDLPSLVVGAFLPILSPSTS